MRCIRKSTDCFVRRRRRHQRCCCRFRGRCRLDPLSVLSLTRRLAAIDRKYSLLGESSAAALAGTRSGGGSDGAQQWLANIHGDRGWFCRRSVPAGADRAAATVASRTRCESDRDRRPSHCPPSSRPRRRWMDGRLCGHRSPLHIWFLDDANDRE